MTLKKICLTIMVIGSLMYSIGFTMIYGDDDIIPLNNIPKTIKVAVDMNMPPLQYKEYNRYKGFNIDILEGVAAFQGFDIKYVPMTLEKSIVALEKGEVDAIIGVSYLANLSESLIFTENILTSSVGLITNNEEMLEREDSLELTDRLIALKRKTVEYQYLQNVRRVQYNTTSNQEDAFYLMLEGRADSLMGDKVITQYLLEKHGLEEEYQFISSYIIPIEYSIAVCKENYNLLYELNDGIRQLKERGIYGEIYDVWFVNEGLEAQKRLERLIKIFVFFVLASSVIFMLSLRWNKQLKREVDKKTGELQKINVELEYQITETKNKNELVNQILQSSPRGMVSVNKEGRIDSCNPRAIEIIGLNKNPIGYHYWEVPIFKKLLWDKIQDVSEKGLQFLSEEMEWKEDEGNNYSIRYMVYPLRDYEQSITGIMISFEDNTAEKKIRAELFAREKNKALNEIVAGVAHEIRNPLTSIKTFVELIPEKLSNPNFQKDITGYVPKEVDRVNQLIENLIDYAKPRNPNKEVIDANQLIQACSGLYKPTVEKKGFGLALKVEENLRIEADKSQMKQVIINFIMNGIEAMEEKSSQTNNFLTLSILGWKDKKSVYIEIVDEGIGMEQEEISSALNPFYTTKIKGTGLGLTLSKQSIEENGGQLIIKSKKNQGTRMRIIFEGRE